MLDNKISKRKVRFEVTIIIKKRFYKENDMRETVPKKL